MPPTNRDSSELTRKRRAGVLSAWAAANTAAVNAGTSVLREQGSGVQSLEVVVQRQQGACYCNAAYQFVGCGPCSGGV